MVCFTHPWWFKHHNARYCNACPCRCWFKSKW